MVNMTTILFIFYYDIVLESPYARKIVERCRLYSFI